MTRTILHGSENIHKCKYIQGVYFLNVGRTKNEVSLKVSKYSLSLDILSGIVVKEIYNTLTSFC